MSLMPVPGRGPTLTLVKPIAPGPGNWVGAPSAAIDFGVSGLGGPAVALAYRERSVTARGAAVVIARWSGADTDEVVELARLDKDRFGAESLERPALIRTDSGQWRLFVSCATPNSKHWWIDVLQADSLAGLATAERHTVFPGDRRTAVKDPVVHRLAGRWQAWICCHPLDEPGAEDRMWTSYATSEDGWTWIDHGPVLRPTPGTWDARGTRLTAVLSDGTAYYDGRASAEENFSERTGLAHFDGSQLVASLDGPVAAVRYLDVLAMPDGSWRMFYEAPLADGSHELRTESVRG